MTLVAEARWAFWAPKLTTSLSFVLVLVNQDILRGSPAMCYLFATTLAVAAGATLVMLARRDLMPAVTLTGLALQAVLLTCNFGAIHHAFGIAGIGGSIRPIPLVSAIYFSTVTWTTLGYGDYAPAEAMQPIAALEALIGYVYLGLIVGLAANRFAGRD